MLDLLKRLGAALYSFTIGGAVRLVKNTREGKVDFLDKRFIGRALTYVGYFALSFFVPQAVVIIGILRVLMVIDVLATLGDIFQSTANSYASAA